MTRSRTRVTFREVVQVRTIEYPCGGSCPFRTSRKNTLWDHVRENHGWTRGAKERQRQEQDHDSSEETTGAVNLNQAQTENARGCECLFSSEYVRGSECLFPPKYVGGSECLFPPKYTRGWECLLNLNQAQTEEEEPTKNGVRGQARQRGKRLRDPSQDPGMVPKGALKARRTSPVRTGPGPPTQGPGPMGDANQVDPPKSQTPKNHPVRQHPVRRSQRLGTKLGQGQTTEHVPAE